MTLKNIVLAFALMVSAVAFAAGPYPLQSITNRYGGEKNIQLFTGGSNQIDCGFQVAAADTGGFGVINVASGNSGDGCASVYMHTSSTPAGPGNPPVGYAIINLNKGYQGYTAGIYHLPHSPLITSSPLPMASASPNTAYTITALGTTPAAGWISLGLPAGSTPAVGNPFITPSPLPSPLPTGTGTFNAPGATGSGITDIEVLGTPAYSGTKSQVIIRFLAATNTTTTTLVATAPADGTVVGLRFTMKGPVVNLQ